MIGSAVQSTVGDASLVVSFSETPTPSDEVNYTVLDTDYDSYAIVYSCASYFWGYASFDYLWILTREPSLSGSKFLELVSIIEDRIPHYDIFTESVVARHGDDCPYEDRPINTYD